MQFKKRILYLNNKFIIYLRIRWIIDYTTLTITAIELTSK